MPLVALLLLLWAFLMIDGAFAHVALSDAVMAAILATGTAFLASLASLLAWRRNGRGHHAPRW